MHKNKSSGSNSALGRKKSYCPAKTNRGRKLYQSRGLPFALNRWYFIFQFKWNLLFTSQKTGFSSLSQSMWLIHFNGAPAAKN